MTRLQNGEQKPQLRVRVEPEQMAYLEIESEREGRTISELVREFLAKAISYHKRSRGR